MMREYRPSFKRRLLAGLLASIMIFEACSGVLDVAASEVQKIDTEETTGKYYNSDITDVQVEQPVTTNNSEVLKKEAVVDKQEDSFPKEMEVIDKRTINSKTYKLDDGTYVMESYFEPIHKEVNGTYEDIDNTLINVSRNTTPIYKNVDGGYQFTVTKDTMLFDNLKGNQIEIQNSDAYLDVYSVNENVVLYSEAYKNIDMEYRLSGSGVSTNFYINGPTDVNTISYSINKGDLLVQDSEEALLFIDEDSNQIFSYEKPILLDESGNSIKPIFHYLENNGTIEVSITFDQSWLSSQERTYPIIMSSRAIDESLEINVSTSYIRSLNPNTTSQYYDLYVGYEDGSSNGGYHVGVTRSFVHVEGFDIGSDKEIVSAKLTMHKKVKYLSQWNEIEVLKTDTYVNPATVKWSNQPTNLTSLGVTNVRSDGGWQDFDITSYIQDLYNGSNKTLMLKATNESSAYTPNIFLGESSNGRPKVSITYRDAFDINPGLEIDTFDSEMRIYSVLDEGFKALSFDGIAKPDATVIYNLVERGQDTVINSATVTASTSRYFVDPIFITNQLPDVQVYQDKDVNYTTDYIYKEAIPEFDVPYEYIVQVETPSELSTIDFRTDSFIKYKVKTGDNLKNIAAYYGLTVDEIKYDNNLTNDIIKEDDILLLRFKKDNPKVSKDVYTPPTRTLVYDAKYVNRGPKCYGGVCEVIDPVNATTGNYYYEGVDFTIYDQDIFNLNRYYNSTGPQLSNMFGNGFTTTIESYISYDKDGNILFFLGDGKIYQFDKTLSGYLSKPQNQMEIMYQDNKATIIDTTSGITYYFDSFGMLDYMVSSQGLQTKIQYDDYGLITSIQIGDKSIAISYNDEKLVQDITLPSGDKVYYTYDENRNLISYKDVNGNSIKYAYDDNNYLTSVQDKNGNTITTNIYDDSGRIVKQTDGNGNVSSMRYDTNSTTLVNSDGSIDVYTFNENYDIVSIQENGIITSSYTYDENRNITTITNRNGKVETYTYQDNKVVKVDYSDGTFEEYRYDSLGNVIYHRDNDGNTVENTYSGKNLVSTKDNKNQQVSYQYDDIGRLLKETDIFGVSKEYTYQSNLVSSISHTNGLIEYFEYDTNGNVLKESDNQGKTTSYVYDKSGQVIQKNYYDGTNEQWVYDANGNIISYKDRIGGITTNTYDKNNNQIQTTKGTITLKTEYDEVNRVIKEINELGLTTTYKYDVYDNVICEIDVYGNETKYKYDEFGNVIETVDIYGNVESNEYDGNNLIKSISKEGLVTTYQYDDFNREISKTNPNGTIETKEYENSLLVKEVDQRGKITEYRYDEYGRNVETIFTSTDGIETKTLQKYDQYQNVIENNNNGIIVTTKYDVYNQEISSIDALGNVTSKEYDFDGNVIKEVDALNNTSTTSYDGMQNVLTVTDKNGNTTSNVYNPNGQRIHEIDALNNVTTINYNNYGQVDEMIDATNVKTEFIYDKYGNNITIKIDGKLVEEKQYDKYGRTIYTKNIEKQERTTFDTFNRPTETINERLGLTKYTVYDKYGNIIEESDNLGSKVVYHYDMYNQKTKAIDAYGRVETYIYGNEGELLETQAFDGTKSTSMYNNHGNVIKVVDGSGSETINTYDAMQRVIETNTAGKITKYVYDASSNIIEEIDGNNNTSTKTQYDANGNPIVTIDALGNVVKTEYDAKNQVIATIDENGNRSETQYDTYGNIIKEIDAMGSSKQYQYNQFGLLALEIDERGFETTYVYNEDLLLESVTNSMGHTVTYTYNEHGQKVKETNPNGDVTTYQYDDYGRETKVTLPSGKVMTKEYDRLENIIKETDGKNVTIHNYDKLGRLVSTTKNNILQIKNVYNQYNQIIETYDSENNVIKNTYDQSGQVVLRDDKGSITTTQYDIYGNIIKEVQNETYITEYTYDQLQRVVETRINGITTLYNEYDACGNEITTIENGVIKKTTYDKNNRIKEVLLPSTTNKEEFIVIQSVEYDASGNPIKITDANGYVETKKYDANNNIIEEVNKNNIVSKYEYDGLNNLIKTQNHDERYVSYIYDKSNNLIEKVLNDTTSTYYKYDEDNNLIYEENEYGYIHEYSYDSFGNKIEWIKPDKTKIKYTYDNLGNMLTSNDTTYSYDKRGNLLTVTNNQGMIVNKYDIFNNKIEVKDTNENIVKYTFDNFNRIVETTYGTSHVVNTYNVNGMLETVSNNGEQVAYYQYNARNDMVTLSQGDIITNKTYDEMSRIKIQTTNQKDKNITTNTYLYDGNDNVIEEGVNGHTNIYIYNEYDELEVSKKYIDNQYVETTYQHDIFGNQIEMSTSLSNKKYVYNNNNQIESIVSDEGTMHIDYDDNGNIIQKININGTIDKYTYDEYDQLVQLEQGQYVYDYHYDGQNQRIKQIKTDTNDYHYDVWYNYVDYVTFDDNEVTSGFDVLRNQVEQLEATNGLCSSILSDSYDVTYYKEPEIIDYTLDRNQEYTEILVSNDQQFIYGNSLLQDDKETIVTGLNNSVIARVENDIIETIEYSDYGITSDIKEGHGYNSEMMDSNGLIYLRARYYDPSISRFIQVDNNYSGEKQDVASQNRYVYTLNNPYKYVDRDGNIALLGALVAVGGAFAVGMATASILDSSPSITDVVKQAGDMLSGKSSPSVGHATAAVTNAVSNANKTLPNIASASTQSKTATQLKPVYKELQPEAVCPDPQTASNSALDILQLVLDIIGFIPFLGDICDAINAVIYFLRGLTFDAVVSIACIALPLVADSLLKPLKWVAKSANEFISQAIKKVPNIDNAISSVVSNAKKWIQGTKLLASNIKNSIIGFLGKFGSYIDNLFAKATVKVSSLYEGSEAFQAWLKGTGVRENKVYFVYDDAGDVIYVGITKQSIEERQKQHLKAGKPFNNMQPEYENLTRHEARALEQHFIEKHDTINKPNGENNINSIAKNNPQYIESQEWAKSFLAQLGG